LSALNIYGETMKRVGVLLGALLLSIAGFAAASTTVLDVGGKLSGLFDAKTYSFDVTQNGVYGVGFNAASNDLALNLFGAFDKVDSSWAPVNGTVGSGSFDFFANSNSQYEAAGDINLATDKLNFDINVSGTLGSSSPSGGTTPTASGPNTWAIVLLGIGFIVYRVRPRKMEGPMGILRLRAI
jgi:hypothetical protein